MARTADGRAVQAWDMVTSALNGGGPYRYVFSGRVSDGSAMVLLLEDPPMEAYKLVPLSEFAREWAYVSPDSTSVTRASSAVTAPTMSEMRAVLEEADAILLDSSMDSRMADSSPSCSAGSERMRRLRSAMLSSRASRLCAACSISLFVILMVNLLTVDDPVVTGAAIVGTFASFVWSLATVVAYASGR